MFKKFIWLFYGRSSGRILYIHRLAVKMKKKKLLLISKFLNNKLEREFNCYISLTAKIHPSTEFIHPTGIIIGKGVVIEAGVKIYQQVTIGGKNKGDWDKVNFPRIGCNSILFSGAKVLGDIRIGSNCTIGANSVVINDIPDNSLAVGSPAVTKKRIV